MNSILYPPSKPPIDTGLGWPYQGQTVTDVPPLLGVRVPLHCEEDIWAGLVAFCGPSCVLKERAEAWLETARGFLRGSFWELLLWK